MSAAAFFRLKKLKGGGILLAAARHNRRTIQAELGADGHINPARSHLNITLCGPPGPDDVPKLAKTAMQAAGVGKLRKDAVVGVEAVFSLPVSHTTDPRQYFAACVEWAGLRFGGADNILSADVHLDEAQPHVHVLVLPLVNGRMAGSDMVGNRRTLLALQTQFFDEVARRFGLNKPKARMTGVAKADASARVIATMKASNDPALKSHAWPVIRAAIESDPAPFVSALGLVIDAKPKRLKSSTAIFTSPGKGPKKEPKQSNPIGFEGPKKEQTLSCVGFASKPLPPIAPIERHTRPRKATSVTTPPTQCACVMTRCPPIAGTPIPAPSRRGPHLRRDKRQPPKPGYQLHSETSKASPLACPANNEGPDHASNQTDLPCRDHRSLAEWLASP